MSPKCSYCNEIGHNILACNKDNHLIHILHEDTEPDFFHMSLCKLKKLASLINIKTSLPKIRLACGLKRQWMVNKNKRTELIQSGEEDECPICYESTQQRGCSMTTCGHMFCTPCLIIHSRNSNSCPMCRHPLVENTHVPPPIHIIEPPIINSNRWNPERMTYEDINNNHDINNIDDSYDNNHDINNIDDIYDNNHDINNDNINNIVYNIDNNNNINNIIHENNNSNNYFDNDYLFLIIDYLTSLQSDSVIMDNLANNNINNFQN